MSILEGYSVLAGGNTTRIHQAMDVLDGVASVANVVSAASTGASAFSSEGPGQAHGLAVVSGNGWVVSTHHVFGPRIVFFGRGVVCSLFLRLLAAFH